MMQKWWEYLAITEENAYRFPKTEQWIAFVLMTITFFIITPQFVLNLYRLYTQRNASGSNAVKNYSLMYFGVYATFLNSYFLRISIFFTNGELSVFGQEKGVLFVFGILLYLMGVVSVSFTIINFRARTKQIIQVIAFAFYFFAIMVMLSMCMIILGNTAIIETAIILQSIAATTGVIFFILFIVSFLFEMRNDPSKIEKLRLILLSIGVFMMVIELLSIGAASFSKTIERPDLFLFVSAYFIPVVYLVCQPIMYLVFNWSIFTPNWLLIKAKIIQPSFREFLNRKK